MSKKIPHRAIPASELRIGNELAFNKNGFVKVTEVKHLSDWNPVSGKRISKVRFEVYGTVSEVMFDMILIVKS